MRFGFPNFDDGMARSLFLSRAVMGRRTGDLTNLGGNAARESLESESCRACACFYFLSPHLRESRRTHLCA